MKYWKSTAFNILFIIASGSVLGQAAYLGLPCKQCTQAITAGDQFGRIYIACGSQLYAFAPDGALAYSFGRNTLGAITSIDASNPMKIAVYFAASNLIFLIDNQGNPIGTPISLSASGTFRASSIGLSSEGNIWLFDAESLILRQLTAAGTVRSQSSDIGKYVNIIHGDSVRIALSQNRILLAEGNNVAVFSAEGAFINTITQQSGSRWINGGNLGAYFLCGDTVRLFNAGSLRSETIGRTGASMPVFASKSFFLTNGANIQDAENQMEQNAASWTEKTVFIRNSYLSE